MATVLRLSKIRPGGGAYYLDVAAGTGTGIEAAGRWLPSGPAPWPRSGPVDRSDLDAVLAGQDPATGETLGSARARVLVAGFDMTFSAPKSVSLLHALGEPEVSRAVGAAQAEAVEAAMSYVDRHALAVRRRAADGPAVPTTVDGVAAAGFEHRMSRALDPHLHTHVVVANLGRGPEGSWSALDGRGLYAHASATDALYHSHLRFELTRRLGVAWDPPDRGRADIAGIAPEARREFSRRAAEIAAHMAEHGWTGDTVETVAAFVTRADKDPHLGADDLRPQWRARALTVGLGPRQLENLLDRAPHRSPSPSAGREEAGLPSAVHDSLADLNRSVCRRDVVKAWGRAFPAGAPASEVEEAADALLDYLAPEPGRRGERQGPGVAERRHQVEPGSLDRGHAIDHRRSAVERAELSRLLARRGFGHDIGTDRRGDRGFGLDR